MCNARFFEREACSDVGLRRDVSLAVLVRPDAHVANDRFFTDVLLERLEFQLTRAPAHSAGGKIAAVDLQPVVEAAFRIQPNDRLSQKRLELVQNLIRLGQLLPGVGEDILHFWYSAP